MIFLVGSYLLVGIRLRLIWIGCVLNISLFVVLDNCFILIIIYYLCNWYYLIVFIFY